MSFNLLDHFLLSRAGAVIADGRFGAGRSQGAGGKPAGTEAFAYTFQAGTSTFKLDAQVPCCGDDWVGPNAPPDPVTSVRAGWARLDDPDGWIPGNPTDLCALDPPMPLYGYSVAIGDGLVYPQDIGYCFDFYPPIPYAQFTPFSYPGAFKRDNPQDRKQSGQQRNADQIKQSLHAAEHARSAVKERLTRWRAAALCARPPRRCTSPPPRCTSRC